MRRAEIIRATGILLLSAGLAACGGGDAEAPRAATQRGIDRSVADIRAAEAAAQKPLVVSKSIGELTGKATVDARDEAARKKPTAKAAAPEAPPEAEAEAPAPAAG